MIELQVLLDGDGAFEDVAAVMEAEPAALERVALLQMGTSSGKPSVGLLIRRKDGTCLMAETTLALFGGAAAAFRGRMEFLEQGKGEPS